MRPFLVITAIFIFFTYKKNIYTVIFNYTIDDKEDFRQTYVREWEQLQKFSNEPLKSVVKKIKNKFCEKNSILGIDKEVTQADMGAFLFLLKITEWKLKKVKLANVFDMERMIVEISKKRVIEAEDLILFLSQCIFEKMKIKGESLSAFLQSFQKVDNYAKSDPDLNVRILRNIFCCNNENFELAGQKKDVIKLYYVNNFGLFKDPFFDSWVDELVECSLVEFSSKNVEFFSRNRNYVGYLIGTGVIMIIVSIWMMCKKRVFSLFLKNQYAEQKG